MCREILALNPERYGLTDPHKSYNLAGMACLLYLSSVKPSESVPLISVI